MYIASKDDFKRELAAQRVHLDLSVPDRLSDEPDAQLGVSLDFQTMRDFGPDGVLRQIPALVELRRLRDALAGLKSPLENQPRFRRLLGELVDELSTRRADDTDGE